MYNSITGERREGERRGVSVPVSFSNEVQELKFMLILPFLPPDPTGKILFQ